MESSDWRRRGLCARTGAPIDWETQSLPNNNQRSKIAAALCAPCEVQRECGLWALKATGTRDNYICGMVYGGVAFPEMVNGAGRIEKARKRLAQQLGVEYTPAAYVREVLPVDEGLRQCKGDGCGYMLYCGPYQPDAPADHRRHCGKGMCRTCYQRHGRAIKAAARAKAAA